MLQCVKINSEAYEFEDGSTLRPESGLTPSGNTTLDGHWVYRSATGKFMDWSSYRNDLACQFDLDLYNVPNA